MADKKGRINSIITRNLCDIIMKEMQDPIVKLSSINEVKVNRDHSFAHVYVAHLQTEKTEELVNFLNKNKGFIRSRLAKSVDLYKIPDLQDTIIISQNFIKSKNIQYMKIKQQMN